MRKFGGVEVTYYFQAKSLIRQIHGKTIVIPQKTGEEAKCGKIPEYSVEKPSIGATVLYTGIKTIQINIEPGIAITVYFVHILNTILLAKMARLIQTPAVNLLCDQCRFPEHGCEDSRVQSSPPQPMPR